MGNAVSVSAIKDIKDNASIESIKENLSVSKIKENLSVSNVIEKIDDLIDMPAKFAYAFTGGYIGKNKKKYYLGQIRFTKQTIGIQVGTSLAKFRVDVGRNKSGNWTLGSKISLGLHRRADMRLCGKVDSTGSIEPKLSIRFLKKVKTEVSGGFKLSAIKPSQYGAKVRGPLMAHLTYSSKKGNTAGICGAILDEKKNWDLEGMRAFFRDRVMWLAGLYAREKYDQKTGNTACRRNNKQKKKKSRVKRRAPDVLEEVPLESETVTQESELESQASVDDEPTGIMQCPNKMGSTVMTHIDTAMNYIKQSTTVMDYLRQSSMAIEYVKDAMN